MDYDADFGRYCDHTVLRAYTPQAIIRRFCDEAKRYKAAAVCVNPVHVSFVCIQLAGTGIRTCTVIGFPLGANKPVIKALEAAEAIKDGAEEVDMVINIGAVRDNNLKLVYEDIKGVAEVAKGKAEVKVIIETCYLNTEEKIKACLLCKMAGADYIKTSTGFGTDGATVEDILLIRSVVGDGMKIKASTGINTRADAEKMIRAGAIRLGTSRTPQIVTNDETIQGVSSENQPPKFV
ncbi:MAG: deoxyribose-phosphate aldolase [Clostridiales Family XIII bacterium]|nr:deoxyribose-phosphate aldolase [Clostridiales Family XIII bacterium]